jgi:hypothetical protein
MDNESALSQLDENARSVTTRRKCGVLVNANKKIEGRNSTKNNGDDGAEGLSLRAAGSLLTRRVQRQVDLIISDGLVVMRHVVCVHDAITDAQHDVAERPV